MLEVYDDDEKGSPAAGSWGAPRAPMGRNEWLRQQWCRADESEHDEPASRYSEHDERHRYIDTEHFSRWTPARPLWLMVCCCSENGRDKFRSVPSRFLHFTRSFSYFQTNTEMVRNTGWQIRKWYENGLACIPVVSVFLIFYRNIPFLLIRYIPFLLLCVAMTEYFKSSI